MSNCASNLTSSSAWGQHESGIALLNRLVAMLHAKQPWAAQGRAAVQPQPLSAMQWRLDAPAEPGMSSRKDFWHFSNVWLIGNWRSSVEASLNWCGEGQWNKGFKNAEYYFGGIGKFCEGNVSDLWICLDLCSRLLILLQVYGHLRGRGRDGGSATKQNALGIFRQKFGFFPLPIVKKPTIQTINSFINNSKKKKIAV